MSNIYERLVSTWTPFTPLLTRGFCLTGECALWANDNFRERYPGTPIYGHAWTRLLHGNWDDPSAYSGYANMPDNYLAYDNNRNFLASLRFALMVDTLKLDKTRPYMVNMWYQGTSRKSRNLAYNEGWSSDKSGKITGTHTGNVYYDNSKGLWRLNHNMSGLVHDEPFYETIMLNPKTKLYGLYGHVPTAIVPFGNPADYSSIVDDFADNSLTTEYSTDNKYENTHPRFPVFLSLDEIVDYINNPEKMYEDYPLGLVGDPEKLALLNSLHIYPTGDLHYSNITSPLIISGLLSAMNESDKIILKYGITLTEFDLFMPLVMGILNQESNGGSRKYLTRSGNIIENAKYANEHLSKFGYGSRSLAGSLLGWKDISSTMGSVKLDGHNPLNYGRGLVDNPLDLLKWNDHLYRDVTYSGPNVMSNLVNNYIRLLEMLGDKANILFNERGGLSQVGKGLLLEAHNQGLEGNIAKSVENYLKDGNIDHLGLYATPDLYYTGPRTNRPSYGSTILYNLNRGFYDTDELMLPGITITSNPSTGEVTTSWGYVDENNNFVYISLTNNPVFEGLYKEYNPQPRKKKKLKKVRSQMIER